MKSICHYLTNLKLIHNIKILIYTTSKYLYATLSIFFSFFTIITKKEQAINSRQKYFHSYDLIYYNKLKVTSKKIVTDLYNPYTIIN